MANLNTTSKEILHNIGKPFDVTLDERVKGLLRHAMAKILKERIDREGIDQHYISGFKINLVKVDIADDCKVDAGCDIYRSENKIPEPIYHKADVPFVNVSSINGRIVFIITTLVSHTHQRFARFTAKTPMYEWRDNYLYFYNINRKMRILVNAILNVSTLLVDDCVDNACLSDESEIPFDEGLLLTVKDLVYKELGYSRAEHRETEEVKVDKNE